MGDAPTHKCIQYQISKACSSDSWSSQGSCFLGVEFDYPSTRNMRARVEVSMAFPARMPQREIIESGHEVLLNLTHVSSYDSPLTCVSHFQFLSSFLVICQICANCKPAYLNLS
ncbi:hypothetical protein M758_UG035800 [Ceratodon purpureus]|nr:hypothetical protein M758_UG035800 [Ceratodon purpureus]